MKILIIEDEVKTAKFLQKGLGEAGYVVDVAANGLEGLHLALEVEVDLIILDVMLPALDGWQVLTRLREADRRMLVLHYREGTLCTSACMVLNWALTTIW